MELLWLLYPKLTVKWNLLRHHSNGHVKVILVEVEVRVWNHICSKSKVLTNGVVVVVIP